MKPNTEIMLAFGEIVAIVRVDMGLNISQLARLFGCTAPYLRRIERERNSAPNKEMVKKIAEILELDFSLLFSVAIRERFLKWCDKENIESTNLAVFTREVSVEQRKWIRDCPNIVKQTIYKRFVWWDGRTDIKRLQQIQAYQKTD